MYKYEECNCNNTGCEECTCEECGGWLYEYEDMMCERCIEKEALAEQTAREFE